MPQRQEQQEFWERRRCELILGSQTLLLQSEPNVSEAAAKGEIKPRGKSVSVDEVIAKIDEHLKKGGSV